MAGHVTVLSTSDRPLAEQHGFTRFTQIVLLERLDGMLVIWWDKAASLYHVFVCFNNPGHPCKMRGTARWEGDSLGNDYEQTVKGKKTSWRDSFTFTSTSHTLVTTVRTGDGTMQTLITTKATRR